MKNSIKIIWVLIFALVFTTIVFASVILPPYDKSKLPGLPLPVAYEDAMTALGSATNQFHCISANVTTTFSSDGEWYFAFYSVNSNSAPKFIAVEFNGKVVFDNGWR